jgi:hypothetical protein
MRALVNQYGPRKWSAIASHLPGRVGKQCRERYFCACVYTENMPVPCSVGYECSRVFLQMAEPFAPRGEQESLD